MAITAPTWFDATNYLNVKTEQLNATKFQGKSDWTNTKTEEALTAAGLTPYEHFMKYGNAENISPNNMFNVAEYLLAKAKQLNADKFEGKTDWTEASVLAAFQTAGLSAWDHYTLYGAKEGNNPSNAFDTNAYMAEKLAQLKATDPAGNWTMQGVIAAFEAANLNPLEHYQLYGKTEGLTAPAVPHDKIVVSNFNPYTPSNPGEVFTLTTAKDTITGTAGNDTVTGVASSLTSEQTLNNTDVIDGAAGTDTLNVTMKGNFNGFTTGSMTNVEIVNLTNTSSINHTFDAKGIKDVETYNIDATGAAVNLRGLDSADKLTVNVKGQTQGTAGIEFTAKAVEGTSDSLNLGLSSVGKAAVGTTAQVPVIVTANGIENLNVKVTDNNIVNLAGAATSSITASGAGSLNVTAVNAGLTSFDATNMSGNINADLSANVTGGIKTVKGGSGDDVFTVGTNGLASTATIAGGAGNDSLVVKGAGSLTLQPTMTGIENVTADGGLSLTLSGKNMSDLSSVTVKNNANVTMSGVQASDFAINAQGTTGGSVITDTATALTVNTKADSTKTNAISTGITASKATTATVNVGVDTQVGATSEMNFAVATDVTVNVAQSFAANGTTENTTFGGRVDANKAASLTVNAKGVLAGARFNVAEATSVTVVAEKGGTGTTTFAADKATDVSITAGADFALASTGFTGAQTVTLVQNKGALTGGVVLSNLNTLNVSGAGTATGKESAVTVGDLGKPALAYGLTVNASGLKGGFTAGDVVAGANAVNLNFAEVTGAATVAKVEGGDITINAAHTGKTIVTGITKAAGNVVINAMGVLGGSTTVDAVTLTGAITAGDDKTVTLNFDGNNDMTFGAISVAGKGTINIDASGYLGNINDATTATAKAEADFGKISADTVVFKGSEIGTNDFNSAADSFTANTFTFTGGLGADLVNVTGFGGTDKAMNVNLNTGNGLDVVNVVAAASNTSIKVTGDLGSEANTVSVTAAAATAKATIDISGLLNYATSELTGSQVATIASDITGGAGIDTITAAAGGGIITGGAGNDLITLKVALVVDKIVVGTMAAAGMDTVTAFASGDKFVFAGATATKFATKVDADLSGATTLEQALAIINSKGLLNAGEALAFSLSGADSTNSYAIIGGSTAGYQAGEDALIHLIGLDATAAAAINGSISATV